MSITLFCLVKGNTTANAFEVDIEKDKSVSYLKEVIKEKNAQTFANVDAKDLKLWKVTIPDDQDDLLSNLSFQDQDEQLLATKKISKYFPDLPPEEHIHVIVEAPDRAEQPGASDPSLTEEVKSQIKFIYEHLKEKFETSSLSTINSDKFQRFLTHTGLTLNVMRFSGKNPKNDIPPYKWTSHAEDHPKQREKILNYFDEHLKSKLPTNIDIVDVANSKDFLNTHKGLRLPFNVRGGTDIILVEREYVKSKLLKPGVHCTIELKKPNVEEKHMWQSILEMIVADMYVKKDVKVFGVLTDLNNFWNIFWLDESEEIIIVPLENRQTAFEVIGKMVKSTSRSRISGMPTINRMKFTDLNRHSGDYNDDVAMMDDFIEEMEENEVLRHNMRKVFQFLQDSPIFSSVLESLPSSFSSDDSEV